METSDNPVAAAPTFENEMAETPGGDGTVGGGSGIYGTASDWSSANSSGALIKMNGAWLRGQAAASHKYFPPVLHSH
jgi:hypothetical protein